MKPRPARWLLALLAPVIMVIGAGLIGIYASGSATSDDAGEPVASSTPQRPAASPTASVGPTTSLGSFDDRYDFRSFAERLARAIDAADAQFLVDNITFTPIACGVSGIPAPPDSCNGQPAGATVPGIIVGVWNTDGFSLDVAGYERFIREFLTEPSDATPDNYGDAKPKLYAYAVFRRELQGLNPSPFPGTRIMEAIGTRVVPGTTLRPKYLPPGRAILLFHAVFDGEQWVIAGLSIPTAATAALLDPSSEAGIQEGSDSILEFWSRWE